LRPWLLQIANARATDHTRRASAQERALEVLAASLRHTQTGRQWQQLDEAERHEVWALIWEAVGLLPTRQQVVYQVFLHHFPESQRMKVLRQLVSWETGQDEPLAAIKRAFQEGRRKVQAHLRPRGYTLGYQGGEQ
jgi:hypothetical protein